ncbi:MAG: hypothetical protein M3282_08415 [Gemmatimonadota bacterium]|nr:hypothetical protein [Gemmatimonadota bacterium]
MTAADAASMSRLFASVTWLVLGATALSCNAPRQPGTPPAQEDRPANPQESTQEQVQRLEREARALARADGCQSSGDCRAAPVGDRPCGGPRTYVVYCARTTDSVALFRKLDELTRAEREYNRQQGLMSTCEFRMPPGVVASGGSCRAAP